MNQSPAITKKQAERIFQEEMLSRDFWLVSKDNDNLNILQNVLDVIYNSIEGNKYSARYSKGQHNIRLCVYCEICRKELSSYDPFVMHDKGKPHKKSQQILLLKDKLSPNLFGDLTFRDPLSPINIFPSGTIEHRLDMSRCMVVGMHFVYKEVVGGALAYTCQLCVKDKKTYRISEEETLHHITSEFHTIKYLSVVHGCNPKASLSDVDNLLRDVIHREGRVNAAILLLESDGDYDRYNLADNHVKRDALPPIPPLPKRVKNSPQNDRRPSHSSSPSPSPSPPIETKEGQTQTEFNTETMSHFVSQLKNCIEEENEVSDLVRQLQPGHKRIVTDVVQVLGKGMIDYALTAKDQEFEKISQKFFEMTLQMS